MAVDGKECEFVSGTTCVFRFNGEPAKSATFAGDRLVQVRQALSDPESG